MKIKELIAKLSELDGDLEAVRRCSEDYAYQEIDFLETGRIESGYFNPAQDADVNAVKI